MSTVDQVYRAAARQPLKIGQYQVDDTVVPALLLDPLSDDSDDSSAVLADRVQALAAGLGTGAAPSTPELDQALAGLLTGALSAMHSAGTAIMCGDAAVSKDPEQYWTDIEARRRTAPLFGPVAATITPCAFWPTTPAPQIRVANHVPALVVSAAGDINAILSMGQAMHHALAGSRMITLDGVRTHGVYLFKGNGCVDDTVNAYLNTGTLPTKDTTCR
jgi:TAP-like protein